MIIKMDLLSELCILDSNEENIKNGIIDSKILKSALKKEALDILNIYTPEKTEYHNYKDIICRLFESDDKNNLLKIANGLCKRTRIRLYEKMNFKGKDNNVFSRGCTFNFSVDKLENKYKNFTNLCLISLRYFGDFNYIGLGEISLRLIE